LFAFPFSFPRKIIKIILLKRTSKKDLIKEERTRKINLYFYKSFIK
jgi:hypothetical protein